MNETLLRDSNHVTVAGAVTNDSDLDVTMLRVDPITKYLLCNISATAATSATESQIASRDQNHRPVCLAWDATNEVLQEVLTDAQGNLLCDVIFT
jgi:hypothetical protein